MILCATIPAKYYHMAFLIVYCICDDRTKLTSSEGLTQACPNNGSQQHL